MIDQPVLSLRDPKAYVIPPIPCPVCQVPFTPVPNRRGKITEACPAHVRKFNARHRVGIVPDMAAKKRRKADDRVQRVLGERFGALTTREIAIFETGQKVGYDRGYNKGYAGLPVPR